MAATYTYPGVYVEEIPSGVRTIVGVSTSDTAFIDFFPRGPVDEAVRITSFGEFVRVFGGLDSRSEASYAIQQYYLNGGSVAWVVRVISGGESARVPLDDSNSPPGEAFVVTAASRGDWGNYLQVGVDHKSADPTSLFNLVVREVRQVRGRAQVVNSETFRNLSPTSSHSSYAVDVVNNTSTLIRLAPGASAGGLPRATGTDVIRAASDASDTISFMSLGTGGSGTSSITAGGDGIEPGTTQWQNTDGAAAILNTNGGIHALDRIAPFVFNLLCIPAAAELSPTSMASVVNTAVQFCRNRRAFMLVDVPSATRGVTQSTVDTWLEDNNVTRDSHGAVYYPRLEIPDPLNGNRPRNVGASGTLAGIYARTDSTRGVWKAPAGTEASLQGASLVEQLTDPENGGLNPLGINVLRNFSIFGNVAWGARTLEGADQQASEWKYIPVRRTALFIEESLYQGLKWVVFEPNDEPLWAQIRLNVGAFMQNLFRQGAFQGKSPREAYFVKCDGETTTQTDRNLGIVNILVGFAPLKPAEFVVLQLQQMAGQIET